MFSNTFFYLIACYAAVNFVAVAVGLLRSPHWPQTRREAIKESIYRCNVAIVIFIGMAGVLAGTVPMFSFVIQDKSPSDDLIFGFKFWFVFTIASLAYIWFSGNFQKMKDDMFKVS